MGQCLSAPAEGGGVEVIECLWFPDVKGMPCHNYQKHGNCRRNNCNYAHEPTSLTRFLKHFDGCRSTLDIAVFTITCNEVANAVEECKKRGVKVRIITDDEQMKSRGSDIHELQSKGIEVRHDNNTMSHMHHKFAVFDNQVVATGSFNWTRQAVLSNQENIVVLRGASVAQQFSAEFDRMWGQFSRNRV